MSLISLSSADLNHTTSQQPFNFKNNFAQPLIIKPHSQVALVNFYHFRNDSIYNIRLNNNRIVFNFDDPQSNGRFTAFLNVDEYSGADLATEIARSLNIANIAFQNFTFACAFTEGNPQASPPVNDVFEITFTSVATPTIQGGTYTTIFNDGSSTIVNNTAPNTKTTISKLDNGLLYSSCVNNHGIHNHEGTFSCANYCQMNGTNSTFIVPSGVNNVYEYSFGAVAKLVGLYADDLCSLNNPNPNRNFSRDKATIQLMLRNSNIRVRTLDRRSYNMTTKRNLSLALGATLHTGLSNFLFTTANAWKEISYKFVFHKDGVSNCAIQLLVSGDGGITYSAPAEGDNTGATFGVNTDGSPNIYQPITINGTDFDGIFYLSKQNGNPLAVGGNNVALSKANVLAKANGKYRCIVSTNNFFIPNSDGSHGVSVWDLRGNVFDVDYGGGGSKFNLNCVEHVEDNGFDFNITTNTQAGTPIANQLIATDLNNKALKQNLNKNFLGLVYDIYADKDDGASLVVGELHFDRRASDNSSKGNISLRSFVGALVNKITKLGISVPTTHIPALAQGIPELDVDGIYNQTNRQRLNQIGVVAEPHHHIADYTQYEDLADVPFTLVGADLASRLVLLVDRVDISDTNANSPFRITPATPSGTIGKLIGYSKNVLSMDAGATSQPVDPTNPFLSDQETLIITKDTTLHIAIPELAGVKSYEGESSQTYKTIKIIPKSDFQRGTNGSLSFTSNYQDFIDINNAQELQLSELTIQVREPDGRLATSLQPVSRATIKIQQNPQTTEANKMEMILSRMERLMSQNQKSVPDVSRPTLTYT